MKEYGIARGKDECSEGGGIMSRGIVRSGGLQSHCGGFTEDQYADSQNQPKSRSGPEFLGLSRCAACYNSMPRRGGDGESSSSAEDSGPEVDSESEAESSSSSSCSGRALSEILEKPETEKPFPVSGDAAEPESGGKDGDGREEVGETLESEKDKSRTKGMTRRAPLVKSYSLPTSFTPHLTPLSLLPRPHSVVSTLNLQVLSQKHDNDASYIVKQHQSEQEESNGGGRVGINNLLPPQQFQSQQTGLPWQQRSQPTLQQHQLSYQYQQQPPQLSHQHQQQQPQHFYPQSAQGQRLPPPLHTLPVLHPPTLHTPLQAPNVPQTHLHALTPCWYCYSMHFPYYPY